MQALSTLILNGDRRQIHKAFGLAADQWQRFAADDDVIRSLALDGHEQRDLINTLLLTRPMPTSTRVGDLNKFSLSNDAEHFLQDLVRASVSGLLLSKKAIIADPSIEAKIGPVRARHEGHPRLVIPLDRDPYWRYYLQDHADSVYTMALQWMRDKAAKSDFSMALASKVINTFESPTDGVETQREAWRRACKEYDRLKSELDERYRVEQVQVKAKALCEKQQLSELNLQFDEAMTTCQRQRDSLAAANRLAVQNLSVHDYECLGKP
jgi:hypothetical protein